MPFRFRSLIRLFLTVTLLSCLQSGARADALAALSTAQRTDLDRVNTYLNQLDRLQAAFMQIAPDGTVSRGNFYLDRPGRMRFEYFPPQDLLIVADGTWVAVREETAGAIQRYPIGATPLSPLLSDTVRLGAENETVSIKRETGLLRVHLRDRKEPEKGEITLIFLDRGGSSTGLELRQWIVVDAQGLTTQVGLSDLRETGPLDRKLFILLDPAPGSQNRR